MLLVMGATGTVGSRLVDLLVDKGEHVRVFCRDVDSACTRFGERVEIARGDFDDPDSIKAALKGADRVVLLTASAAEPGAQLRHERNVIAAAKEAGVHRVLKLSVLGADEHSPMRYARWHRQAATQSWIIRRPRDWPRMHGDVGLLRGHGRQRGARHYRPRARARLQRRTVSRVDCDDRSAARTTPRRDLHRPRNALADAHPVNPSNERRGARAAQGSPGRPKQASTEAADHCVNT